MDRMEYIREKLAEFSALAERFVYQSYFSDVSYLLERIDELERENEKRMIALRRLIHDIDEWEEAVKKIIGRQPRATWGNLEDARKLIEPTT